MDQMWVDADISYALTGVSNVALDLPPSYREQVDRHIDQLMEKGLGDVVEKAINGDKSDFEKFLETALPKEKRGIRTARGKIQARGKMKNAAKHSKENFKKNRRPIVPLEKKKDACRCNKCMAKSLGKTIKEYQTPKTVNNVDPVKEARRQARKARIQVAKLKEAAREARRQTVEVKRRADPYAAGGSAPPCILPSWLDGLASR